MSDTNNPTIDVRNFGQSFWYDNIQRAIIHNGELQSLIDGYGVLGITSNPAIFEKAITGSADYDAQLANLAESGLTTEAIYEALAIQDIQQAADLLEPVFEQSNGIDGYVSLEVSPTLAHDTEGTIKEARRLHKAVARKNLMVKVPATEAGIPAIKQLIADGIAINVTLIFSLDGYEKVARAYIAGLAERAKKGKPVEIASVASFFVSRVDSLIDKQLDEKIAASTDDAHKTLLESLKSKAAIANAKLAYELFERIFAEPRFEPLRAKGARPQRVLWASTSTKNPALKDTHYAEALIGPDTVNTLPPATLKAFRDHGVVAPTLAAGRAEAHNQIAALRGAGIDLDAAMEKLQRDGVKLFADAFVTLMDGIAAKRGALIARGRVVNADSALGYLDELINLKAASRVWQRDAALWTHDPAHTEVVSKRLGWLDVNQSMQAQVDDLIAFRESVKDMGVTDAVVLGMGANALVPNVMREMFGLREGGLMMHVLDTTDPISIAHLEKSIDLRRTVFVLASKTGATLEISSFYKYFRAKVDAFEPDTAGRRFIAITDAGSVLQQLATDEHFGRIFVAPSDIGGRFAAMSYFGLVPAVLQGVDIRLLLERAQRMAAWCASDSAGNPGLWLGALMGGMALGGHDKLSLLLPAPLQPFGGYIEALIAESTGKQERGIVPVAGELRSTGVPLTVKGGPNALSEDRLFVVYSLRGQTDGLEKFAAGLKKAGRPVIEFVIDDIYDIGAEIFRWQFATALSGVVLGVNPFDEPNVTESKLNTQRLLSAFEESGEFEGDLATRTAHGQLGKFLRSGKAGDYIALMAFLPADEQTDELLGKLRNTLREKTGLPVTLGYGPRFLHGTGQLHKAGANNVLALQLTYDAPKDLLIAGEPYAFATVLQAQALGDLEALHAHGRRALRIHLGADVASGIRKIVKAVTGGTRKKL
jgi:transaldolase / glucose-6-phosphate isomerase